MKRFLFILFIAVVFLNSSVSGEDNNSRDKVTFNNNVEIDSKTKGNIVTFFGDTIVKDIIEGDIVSFFGDIKIDENARIDGSVVVFFGNADIKSNINGDLVIFFGKINMGENIKVGGDLVTTGSIDENDNIEVNGNEVMFNLANKGILVAVKYGSFVVGSIFILFCGMIFVMVFRKWVDDVIIDLEIDFGRKIGIGILTQFTLIVACLLFGALVLPILVYLVLLVIANILTCLFLGKLVLKSLHFEFNSFIIFLIGFLIELVFKFIYIYIFPGDSILLFVMSYFAYCLLITTLGLGILVYYMKFREISKTI